MRQIAILELNEDTAGILARVERGEVFEITDRDRTVAHLVPAEPKHLVPAEPAIRLRPETVAAVGDDREPGDDRDLGIKDHESW